ncbi:hypothetical protein QBC47DRAFT_390740 [Echria macrotheca]|uniref:Guanine nucleotide-exchange factor SEC12 n=1 Tax=Echria macrotheca TaxID=438768 RepID=A0AAJ0B778_9PEZI|nr:hypothetical protein QBC47DRAFT_390740 [Echria macrotheca]
MAPLLQTASQQLSYPLYACDFDPQDANRLVVGGGGGPGRSGVSNQISVLDVSHQDSIQVVSELKLSSDEDSVTTLAVGPRRRNSILVFAGINSSPAEVAKGKNEHFRVFAVDQPSKSKTTPSITKLSQATLFASKDTDTYQRLLRISPWFPDKPQIGAVATRFAKTDEIAVFDVPTTGTAPKLRGTLELPKEATDMDIIQTGDSEYQLVYCDDYEIYTMQIGKKTSDGPRCVFTVPHDESPRPSFRSLRYLTPTFVLATANIPKSGGVVLQGFRLPKPEQGTDAKARLAISAKLPKTVTMATGMAVRNLSPPSLPTAKYGDSEFVIAVAGQDRSVTIYKVDHLSVGEVELLANLHPVTTLRDVHAGPISGLAFSHFVPPKTPTMRQLHVKLASIGSMGNSCVVHSLPLKRLVDKTATAGNRRSGPPRMPRYVLALKSHGPSPRGLIFVLTLMVAFLAIIGQTYLELRGASPNILGARRILPQSWQGPLPQVRPPGFLAEYLAEKQLGVDDKVVVLDVDEGDNKIRVDAHDEGEHGPAVEWHDLPEKQKAAWKDKLKKAGHWGEELGENVFKGVLFGEIGGLVGQVVREL